MPTPSRSSSLSAGADLLVDGPAGAPLTVALAHGAGVDMGSPFMSAIAQGLAARGLRVLRFEFPYMAARREGRRPPPDRPAVLLETWRGIIARAGDPDRLVIGGKSMGGRMASLVADEAGVAGLLVHGFPFHAPGKPAAERIEHMAHLKTPTLIVQGTRDPMGNRDEVAGYTLSPTVELCWIEDGDHSFVPRKSSGFTLAASMARVIEASAAFAHSLG